MRRTSNPIELYPCNVVDEDRMMDDICHRGGITSRPFSSPSLYFILRALHPMKQLSHPVTLAYTVTSMTNPVAVAASAFRSDRIWGSS